MMSPPGPSSATGIQTTTPSSPRRAVLLLATVDYSPALPPLLLRLLPTHDVVVAPGLAFTPGFLAGVPHVMSHLPNKLLPGDVVVAKIDGLNVELNALIRAAALSRIPILQSAEDYDRYPLEFDPIQNARAVFEQFARMDLAIARSLHTIEATCLKCPETSGLAFLLSALTFENLGKPVLLDDVYALQFLKSLISLKDVEDEFKEWTCLVAINGPLNTVLSEADVQGESPYPFPAEARAAIVTFIAQACIAIFDELAIDVKTIVSVGLSRRLRIVSVDQDLVKPEFFTSPAALVSFMANSTPHGPLFTKPLFSPSNVRQTRIALMGSTPGGTSSQPLLDTFGKSQIVIVRVELPVSSFFWRLKQNMHANRPFPTKRTRVF